MSCFSGSGHLGLNDIADIKLNSDQNGAAEMPVTQAKISGWCDNEFASCANRPGDLACYSEGQLR